MSGPTSKSADSDTSSASPTADARPSTQPAPKTAGDPLAKPVPPNSSQPAPKDAAQQTAAITLLGKFENRPGATTKGVNDNKTPNALWVELGMMSTKPTAKESKLGLGLSRGGSKPIGSFDAPLEGGAHPHGTGEISTELKYADSVSRSANVVVTNVEGGAANRAKAHDRALALLVAMSKTKGDVLNVIGPNIAEILRADFKSPALQVEISASDDKLNVTDAGLRTLYYRVDSPVTILMNFNSVTAAEAAVHSGKTTEQGAGSGTEAEAHGSDEQEHTHGADEKAHKETHDETSEEQTRKVYREAVVKTTVGFTTSLSRALKDVKKRAIEDALSRSKTHTNEKGKVTDFDVKFEDFTANLKTGSESGEKDKKNWVAKLQEVFGIGKTIAGVLPKGGPWSFGFDVLGQVAGMFATKGHVHYNDAHDDAHTHRKTTNDHHQDSDHNVDTTTDTASITEQELKESFDAASREVVRSSDEVVTEVSQSESKEMVKHSTGGSIGSESGNNTKDTDKHSGGSSSRKKSDENKKTRLEYDVTTKETFMRPVLEATIVNGRGEVSGAPFGSDSSNE